MFIETLVRAPAIEIHVTIRGQRCAQYVRTEIYVMLKSYVTRMITNSKRIAARRATNDAHFVSFLLVT